MDDLNISMLAIGIAVVANFIFGFLWYTPLFGKVWAKEMGFNPNPSVEEKKAMMGLMVKGMMVMVIGNFFLAYVLSHNIAAWDYVPGMNQMSKTGQALNAALFTWLGFFLPTDVGTIFWEKRSFKLFLINTGNHLASLVLVSFIIIFVR